MFNQPTLLFGPISNRTDQVREMVGVSKSREHCPLLQELLGLEIKKALALKGETRAVVN